MRAALIPHHSEAAEGFAPQGSAMSSAASSSGGWKACVAVLSERGTTIEVLLL